MRETETDRETMSQSQGHRRRRRHRANFWGVRPCVKELRRVFLTHNASFHAQADFQFKKPPVYKSRDSVLPGEYSASPERERVCVYLCVWIIDQETGSFQLNKTSSGGPDGKMWTTEWVALLPPAATKSLLE